MAEEQDQIADFLSAATDAMAQGPVDLEGLAVEYGVSLDDARPLLDLAVRLDSALNPVEPSHEFTANLRAELIGEERPLAVVRKMPWRVRIVAGVMTVLGVWLLRRRFKPQALDEGEIGIADPLKTR